jgi:hypothetical protein
MPWSFSQGRGDMMYPDGQTAAAGYSGRDAGYNNPQMQSVDNTGPVPRGGYSIGAAFTHAIAGPVTMRLIPDHSNLMFGRDGFMIHGDTPAHFAHPRPDNSASHGCIVLPHNVREDIANSTDRRLVVTT